MKGMAREKRVPALYFSVVYIFLFLSSFSLIHRILAIYRA